MGDHSKHDQRRQNVIAGPAAWDGLTLIDPHERNPARARRFLIYAAIYSIAGVVAVGKLLFWWLQ